MSKVIHLSDEAHAKAKAFCREHGLKMSDWVANLIDTAMQGGEVTPIVVPQQANNKDSNVRALVQKKKQLEAYEEQPQVADDGLPVYAAPPFWAKANG